MGIKTITITWLLIQLEISSSDWKEVERGVDIPYLENTQLVIQTDSVLGSNDWVDVYFYSLQEQFAGGFVLWFDSSPIYYIGYCYPGYKPLPAHLPAQQGKVWNITKTGEPRLVITCNDVEVVNILLSDSNCTVSHWYEYWSRHATHIVFQNSDTASDYYLSTAVIHGGWSDYEDWTECSADCDGGTQTRTRTCNNPAPDNGGKECEGEDTRRQSCNTHPCPVDGGWSHYGDWSECSADCDGGTQTRTRTCNNSVPANGGKECEGNSTQNQSCNTHLCPGKGSGDKNTLWIFVSLASVLFLTTVLSVGYIIYLHRINKTRTSKTEIMLSDKTAIIEAAADVDSPYYARNEDVVTNQART